MREPIQSYLLIKTHPLDVNMALGIDYLVRCDLSVGVSLRQWMKWHDWCWKHSRGTACEALRPRQRHGLVVYRLLRGARLTGLYAHARGTAWMALRHA